jgi:peptidoglycan-associated lipoprotein
VIRGDERVEVSETDVEALQRAIQEGQVRPVFFNYDSAELSREAKDILEENSRWFRRYPNVGISLEGHCDERGTEEYNLALGDQRAQAARSYLIDLGVASRQLQAISFGEERPFVSGSTESAWAKNRRAHFVVR